MTERVSASAGGSYLNAAVVLLALTFGACSEHEQLAAQPPAAPATPATPTPTEPEAAAPERPAVFHQIGVASWYGGRHHGRRTASGAPFDMRALTAAHRSLPLGTVVRVENLTNGRSLALTITDRGPYVADRVIDLSLAAARGLGLERQGVGLVGITVLSAASELVAAH